MTIIRKVKEQERAEIMLRIADENLISASYEHSGRWYVISFECTSDYHWKLLHKELKKKLN